MKKFELFSNHMAGKWIKVLKKMQIQKSPLKNYTHDVN